MIEIWLRGAPMGKERIRTTKAGHVYTPERTVTYEGRLAYAAQQVMADRPPLDGPLAVDILILVPIAPSWPRKRQEDARAGRLRPTKKPDWDNYAKLLDALNLNVWIDDSQIVQGSVRKFYSDTPGMRVTVSPAPDEKPPMIIDAEGIFG